MKRTGRCGKTQGKETIWSNFAEYAHLELAPEKQKLLWLLDNFSMIVWHFKVYMLFKKYSNSSNMIVIWMYPIVYDSVLHYREYIGANSTFLDTRPLHCMAPLTSPDMTTRRPPPLPPRPFPPPVVVSRIRDRRYSNWGDGCGFFCQAYVLQMASRNEERTADAVALDLEDWQPVDSPMFVPFLCPCQAC